MSCAIFSTNFACLPAHRAREDHRNFGRLRRVWYNAGSGSHLEDSWRVGVAKGKKKSPAKTSWLRRLRRNKGQLLFLILGLLVVISMIVSLIVVALPQPVHPRRAAMGACRDVPLAVNGPAPLRSVGRGVRACGSARREAFERGAGPGGRGGGLLLHQSGSGSLERSSFWLGDRLGSSGRGGGGRLDPGRHPR